MWRYRLDPVGSGYIQVFENPEFGNDFRVP